MSHDRGCPCGKERCDRGYRECSSCVPEVKVRRAKLEELKAAYDAAYAAAYAAANKANNAAYYATRATHWVAEYHKEVKEQRP